MKKIRKHFIQVRCKPILTFLTTVMISGTAMSQSSIVEDFKPSSLNQPGQEYPQVNSQGYARFKIWAPSADSVKVSLGLGGRGGTRLKQMADRDGIACQYSWALAQQQRWR